MSDRSDDQEDREAQSGPQPLPAGEFPSWTATHTAAPAPASAAERPQASNGTDEAILHQVPAAPKPPTQPPAAAGREAPSPPEVPIRLQDLPPPVEPPIEATSLPPYEPAVEHEAGPTASVEADPIAEPETIAAAPAKPTISAEQVAMARSDAPAVEPGETDPAPASGAEAPVERSEPPLAHGADTLHHDEPFEREIGQPSALGQPVGTIPEAGPTRRRGRGLVLSLGLVVLAMAAGAVGWYLGQSDSSTSASGGATDVAPDTAAEDGTAPSTATGDDQATGTAEQVAAPSTTAPKATTITSITTTETAPSGPFAVPETDDNPSGATQYAVMAGTTTIMRGWYPSEEVAEKAVADAAAIMGGMEHVVDETQIDPRAEIGPDGFTVYFENYVLFESDSAEITEEFSELLEFPLTFMMNSPDATVTVVARTDASGPADYNLELSTRRAEAVRDFWLANGAGADQIVLDPRGEQDADEDASAAQAALDRRVELQVSGFLTG